MAYFGRHMVVPESQAENVSGVIVLPILITLKFVHKKFQQKYRWIEHVNIYHYAKSEVEQKFLQEEIKKRNLLLNSCGLTVHLSPVTRYYLQADFLFLFLIAQISIASQILHDGRCLHALSIYIFVRIFYAQIYRTVQHCYDNPL